MPGSIDADQDLGYYVNMNRKAPTKPNTTVLSRFRYPFQSSEVSLNSEAAFGQKKHRFPSCINLPTYLKSNHSQRPGRPSSVVERVAFNHVVVGSIPTDGAFVFYFFAFCTLSSKVSTLKQAVIFNKREFTACSHQQHDIMSPTQD